MDRDFMLEDVEILDFELDVAVKEVFPPLENLEVIPTKEEQTFNHESSYGYDEVVVKPIPDEYIIPEGLLPITENTTYDVRQYARVSANVHPAPVLQDKELTITENGTYVLRADEEYEGLNEVTVSTDAIEVLTEELETYNSELTEQETTINDIVQMLKDKGIGEKPKYAPRYISFRDYKGADLDYELANLDISNMTSMSHLFDFCSNITSFDLTFLDVSSITDFYYTFANCTALALLNISNWNISNATDISFMFRDCNKLTSLDLSSFNTENVVNMESLFHYCNKLTSLDLSSFNTPNLKNTWNMFSYCRNLKHIDMRNFDFTNVTSYNYMFYNVPADCEIIVKDDTAKEWITSKFATLTNVKTVAEYEG